MISTIDSSNEHILFLYASLDPIMSCRIVALYSCYKNYPELAKFYHNHSSGLVCLLGENLILSGEHDGEELFEFARIFSCKTISGRIGSWYESFADLPCTISPVMSYKNTVRKKFTDHIIDPNPDRRRVYNILCEDEEFRASTDPLHWISDVATRERLGAARLYTIGDMATAGVYFIAQNVGIIAGVVTRQQYRKKGLAATLIEHITAELTADGYLPVIIAADDGLEKFYSNLGFFTIYSHCYILLQ